MEIVLDLAAAGNAFRLDFEHRTPNVGATRQCRTSSITAEWAGDRIPWAGWRPEPPASIRAFVDAGSVEIYADGGRWAGRSASQRQAGVGREARPGRPDARNVAAARIGHG